MPRRLWLAELVNALEGGLYLTSLCFLLSLCVKLLFGGVFGSVPLATASTVQSPIAIALGFLLWWLLLVQRLPRPTGVGRATLGWLLWTGGSILAGVGPGITSEPTGSEILLATGWYCGIFGAWGGVCFRVAFGPGSWRQWLCYAAWVTVRWAVNILSVILGGFPFAAAHPLVTGSFIVLSAFTWSVAVVLWCQDHRAAHNGNRLVNFRTSGKSSRYVMSKVSVLLILLALRGLRGF